VDCWSVWSGAAGTFLLIPVDAERVYGWASATKGGAPGADPQWLWSTFAHCPEPVSSALSSLRAEPGLALLLPSRGNQAGSLAPAVGLC
jgi:hypothetical protein